MAAPIRREFKGPLITYEEAVEDELNLLSRLKYRERFNSLEEELWRSREEILSPVRLHLGLGKQEQCTVLEPQTRVKGGFNLCGWVDVTVAEVLKKVVFCCCMPHRCAEEHSARAVDEKRGWCICLLAKEVE